MFTVMGCLTQAHFALLFVPFFLKKREGMTA